MGSRYAGNLAARAFGRHPEGVALPLYDEGRDFDLIELAEAALLGAARRVEWEGEAHDGDRVRLGCGAARDPRAQRSTTGQDREAAEGTVAQLRDDRGPGRVQLGRWSGATPSRYTVRLLDERNFEPGGVGGFGGADKVRRLDPAASPVTEDERSNR
jgi:hypothetical protein